MGLAEATDGHWQPWMSDPGTGSQIAGYKTVYEHGFTFATVKGAGHMVPETQPAPALALLHRFLGAGPLNDPEGENSRGHAWLVANGDQLGNVPVAISTDPVATTVEPAVDGHR